MSAHPCDPLAADASLHLLADHLAEALADGELAPCLLHVGDPDAEGFDLGVLPLEGRHPTEVLLGTVAPPDWHAVGMATSGWAYHVAERGDPRRRRRRVHVVSLVSRSGEHAHRTHAEDPELRRQLSTGEPPEGEQVDLLRRCLGLPTPPPPVDSCAYWSIQWLSDLVARGDVSDLEAALDLHPAMRLLRHGVRGVDADATDVVAAFHRVLTWPRLRALAARARFEVPELSAEEAAWLDDGSFARYVLNRCPPLHLLRRQVAERLPTEVATAVASLLDDLAVPDAAWPDLAEPPAA